ncbi:MAG: hypothetical protein JNM38_05680 [Acidobacteria bacterium]|jgi:hypothetical protein|nr:hypothetical protein [Acidobacteriota bacterium]
MSVSATSSTSGTTAIQDLAASLIKGFDTNKDGSLSADEFSGLVTQLAAQFGVTTPASTAYKTTASTTPITSLGAGNMKFEGFDLGRAQDTTKSAKDAFAMLASRTGSVPSTKTEAESWFNTNIKGEMEALGHKINWVQGDKFQFTNWQGTFTVDFVRGADGDNPALSWQAENA